MQAAGAAAPAGPQGCTEASHRAHHAFLPPATKLTVGWQGVAWQGVAWRGVAGRGMALRACRCTLAVTAPAPPVRPGHLRGGAGGRLATKRTWSTHGVAARSTHRVAAWRRAGCSAAGRRGEAHAAVAAKAPLRPGEDGVCFGRLLVVHDEHLHVRAQRVVRRELLEDRDLRVGRRRAAASRVRRRLTAAPQPPMGPGRRSRASRVQSAVRVREREPAPGARGSELRHHQDGQGHLDLPRGERA